MDIPENENLEQQIPPAEATEQAEEILQETADTMDQNDVVEEVSGIPQQMPPMKRGGFRKFLKAFLRVWTALLVAFVLILASSVVTAFLTNLYWQREKDMLNQATQNRLNVLMERIEALAQGRPQQGTGIPAPEGGMTPAQVYNKNANAVVAISAKLTSANLFGQATQGEVIGSGFLISADGYVATNYHVVEGTGELNVITFDNQQYPARLVGYDAINDVAVLKIEANDLPHVTLGSSDALIVGDQVTAIGNPLGTLSSTLTVGYVSAKDRMVTTSGVAINMLQTDAAINSGNSGGPLFNMAGQVVGITTAKYSGYSTSGASIEGIGFAIPIDDVVDVIMDLQNYGYITGAYLGVSVRDVSAQLAAEYGLPLGTRVEEVVPGISADRAGIILGDIIIDLGGYEITCISDLSRALRKFDAGEETTITVFRSGAKVNLKITLDEKPREVPAG